MLIDFVFGEIVIVTNITKTRKYSILDYIYNQNLLSYFKLGECKNSKQEFKLDWMDGSHPPPHPPALHGIKFHEI